MRSATCFAVILSSAMLGTHLGTLPEKTRTDTKLHLQPTEILVGADRSEKRGEVEWSRVLAESMGLDPETATEYRLPNGARIDIIDRTRGVAWEVEWSDKWPESFGQAGFYADATGLKPGVILLLRGDYEEDWLECLSRVAGERGNGEFVFWYIRTEK